MSIFCVLIFEINKFMKYYKKNRLQNIVGNNLVVEQKNL